MLHWVPRRGNKVSQSLSCHSIKSTRYRMLHQSKAFTMNITWRISWILAPNTFFVFTILSARSVIRPHMFWYWSKSYNQELRLFLHMWFKLLLGPDWKGNHLWLIGNPCENNFSLFSLLLAIDIRDDFLNNSHNLFLLRFLQFFWTWVSRGSDILWRWSWNNEGKALPVYWKRLFHKTL